MDGTWPMELKFYLYCLLHGCDIIVFSEKLWIFLGDEKIHSNFQSTPNIHSCDTTRDQVSSATVPQKHYVPDPAGKKVTVPGSMYIQTDSSQRLPANNILIAVRLPALRWVWGEWTWHLQMDTKDFTTCVTYLIFTSDTHINNSRKRSSQRTVSWFQPHQTEIKSSSKPIKATDYNATAHNIPIQNGSSHLTREQKICYQLNRFILYSVWCKDSKSDQSTPSLFL